MYLDRLREAEYIAPSGNSRNFFFDDMVRTGGKKGGVKEIVDSNYSVVQDQGNLTYKYPIRAYFPGENYDEDIDRFVELLEERASRTTPATLRHPRWGNIDVIPLGGWTQTEKLIDKKMIGFLEINFVKVTKPIIPLSFLDILDQINSVLGAINTASTLVARTMDLSNSALGASVVAKFRTSTTLIAGTISNVGRSEQGIQDSIDFIVDNINAGLDDIADSIEDVILNTQLLIRLATGTETTSTDKTISYGAMTETLLDVFYDPDETSDEFRRSDAILLEAVAGFSVAATCEAGATTDFTIASDSISAVDVIIALFEDYKTRIELTRVLGNASIEFSGDHNSTSLFYQAVTLAQAYILNNSFDLKNERRFTLKEPTDIITFCYKYYGNVDQETISFVIDTNKLSDYRGEFVEIPLGTEMVYYA